MFIGVMSPTGKPLVSSDQKKTMMSFLVRLLDRILIDTNDHDILLSSYGRQFC